MRIWDPNSYGAPSIASRRGRSPKNSAGEIGVPKKWRQTNANKSAHSGSGLESVNRGYVLRSAWIGPDTAFGRTMRESSVTNPSQRLRNSYRVSFRRCSHGERRGCLRMPKTKKSGRGGWRPGAGRKPCIRREDVDPATAEFLAKRFNLEKVWDGLLNHRSADVRLRAVVALMKQLPADGEASQPKSSPRFSTRNPFEEQADRDAQIHKLERSLGLEPSLPPAPAESSYIAAPQPITPREAKPAPKQPAAGPLSEPPEPEYRDGAIYCDQGHGWFTPAKPKDPRCPKCLVIWEAQNKAEERHFRGLLPAEPAWRRM